MGCCGIVTDSLPHMCNFVYECLFIPMPSSRACNTSCCHVVVEWVVQDVATAVAAVAAAVAAIQHQYRHVVEISLLLLDRTVKLFVLNLNETKKPS